MILTKRKIKVFKKGEVINIYHPCNFSDNYIHYEYKKQVQPGIHMNQWKVCLMATATPDLEDVVIFGRNIEWEGAIHETGGKGFIAGYHGNEECIDFSIVIDNRLVDPESDFEVECNYLKLTTMSVLNRFDTPDVKVFRRNKVSEWSGEGYTVSSRYEALEDLFIKRFESTMMALPLEYEGKRFITHGASAKHPTPVEITYVPEELRSNTLFGRDHYNNWYEVYAPEHNFRAKVESVFDYDKYPNATRLCDSWQVTQFRCFKAYFDMTGKHAAKKGEIFLTKSIYTLEW